MTSPHRNKDPLDAEKAEGWQRDQILERLKSQRNTLGRAPGSHKTAEEKLQEVEKLEKQESHERIAKWVDTLLLVGLLGIGVSLALLWSSGVKA